MAALKEWIIKIFEISRYWAQKSLIRAIRSWCNAYRKMARAPKVTTAAEDKRMFILSEKEGKLLQNWQLNITFLDSNQWHPQMWKVDLNQWGSYTNWKQDNGIICFLWIANHRTQEGTRLVNWVTRRLCLCGLVTWLVSSVKAAGHGYRVTCHAGWHGHSSSLKGPSPRL